MKALHSFGSPILGLCDSQSSFILANKRGDFLFLPSNAPISRFQGCYFKDKEMYKTISNIRLSQDPDMLCNNLSSFERRYHSCREVFSLDDNHFIYKVEGYTGYATLSLDMRKMYDFSSWGRIYSISQEKGILLIEYAKYSDPDLKEKAYGMFIAVSGIESFERIENWRKECYPYDEKRGSNPYESYVFDAIKIAINGRCELKFSFGLGKEEVIRKLSSNASKKEKLRPRLSFDNELLNSAYICSVNSLSKLSQENGIYAGLPWFFQHWARDELICLPALILEGKKSFAKEILNKYISCMDKGKLNNYAGSSDLKSADALGWLCHSLRLLSINSKKLEKAALDLIENSTQDGFAVNKALETWMDTSYMGDAREGARIEIQALRLLLYNMVSKHNKDFASKEKDLKEKVRKNFFRKGRLADGLGDFTQRPNIFIAYHVYPDLLEKDEWESAFDCAIDELWNDYGGFSTISYKSPLYCNEYTGEDNMSYHRGDSWFFLNNIAAICMMRLNKEKYKERIQKIMEAAIAEILFSGAIGDMAEVSSSSELRSEGCFAQAWSAATFIEFCHELKKAEK